MKWTLKVPLPGMLEYLCILWEDTMKRRWVYAISSTLVLLMLVLPAVGASAGGGTAIRFVPSTMTAKVGDTVDVDVQVVDASALYAIEIHIAFDPARLQVLDDNPVEPGVQILPGSLFPRSDPSYIVQNRADNTSGTVDFAITLLAPESPINGTGTLATIRFAARMEGNARLWWRATQLADRDGNSIAHTTQEGNINITAACPSPGKNCTDLIVNGGFEDDGYWEMPITPHPAAYSTADRHGGSRSVRLGIEPGDANIYSHSSAYQKVRVPANADSITLSFWARRFTDERTRGRPDPTLDLYDPARVIAGKFDWHTRSERARYDWQEVLVLQGGCYNWLATLMRERSNDGVWTQYTYDLTPFRGQEIVIYFNVINNGYGGRTWMYVDDVQVLACYNGSPCVELVRNRSFEWTADWELATTPRPASYTTDAAHTGARSMRLGIVPPTSDAYSHSSVYQQVYIPEGAVNPTLTFWYKAYTQDTTRDEWRGGDQIGYDPADVLASRATGRQLRALGDWQEMLILDESYRLLSGGVVLRQTRNDGLWRQVTYDLSPYRGLRIVLYFNVINDGDGKRTWMYVDDVSVNLCGHRIYFDPPSVQVGIGATTTVDVHVDNIADLYGLQVTVRFDPAVLEVVDADPAAPGVQVGMGSWWPASTRVITNVADNASGAIYFAATLVAPTPALNGSGDLLSIPLRGRAVGNTFLSFSALKLVDASANVIPIARADGQVTVTSDQATLSGRVLLEGRTDYSGTLVRLDGGAAVTTGADGRYTFLTAAGTHTITFAHESYLSASARVVGVAGSTVTVSDVTLSGGDVNGDGRIDILDLVAVAAQFGSTSPSPETADINADGQVDIVDVVLVAKNMT